MALITCPECGHQVSDKANTCPNCGCPTDVILADQQKYVYDYKGVSYNVACIVQHMREGKGGDAIQDIWNVFGEETPYGKSVSFDDTEKLYDGIKSKYNIVIPEPVKPAPKCPTCGSTKIHKLSAGARGVSLGLFGLASKTARSQFVCDNCGYKW